MKVISLTCNHCGAPLEVSKTARFVTCGFCEARLAIQHTGSSYSTELLEDLQHTTQKLVEDVASIKKTSDIELLDREWEQKVKRHMVTGKNGHQSLPDKSTAVVGGVVTAIFGGIWTLLAGGMAMGAGGIGRAAGAPPVFGFFAMLFPLFGVVFIFAGIAMAVSQAGKADAYQRDLREYQRKRREMMSQRDAS